ncbi:hypothetical protein D9X30_0597 [Cupriavidus sp. U2]|uniref:hypothetical protein n=1 Tax=Cupriavidus sp. U2 TaxID=2920269 RepID=UPI00129DEBCC|nr:hypothetical protein [Cupriavidus sp. U2]KAI3594365.1 hypothetical protein D9X30_0597 [Cupriavidus sp. U2]
MKSFTKDKRCGYFRSFVGSDGGNLENTKFWLGGIEHGEDGGTLGDVTTGLKPVTESKKRRVQ